MSKIKLSLTASPTFKKVVHVPVPGSAPVAVEFTFKAKTRDEFKAFTERLKDMEDEAAVLEVACGWELEDAFDAENVAMLLQNHLGAARVILEGYIGELTGARLGNSAR